MIWSVFLILISLSIIWLLWCSGGKVFTFFISLRYIKQRTITWFSILGVALGVMVLIIVLSVMDGFRLEFMQRLQGILSHITVTVRTSEQNYADLEKKILSVEHVQACAPHIRGVILIGTNKYYVGGMVLGIDAQKEFKVGNLKDYLVTAYQEKKIWGEGLLEKNVVLPYRLELSWTVGFVETVEKDGIFPAGERVLTEKLYKYVDKLKKEDMRLSIRKEYIAYTFDENGKIIFMERQLPSEIWKNRGKLDPIKGKKWQRIFNSMAEDLDNRNLDAFMSYYSKQLRFSTGSLDPDNPFYIIPEDPDEIVDDLRPVIMGYELMRQLEIKPGDEIALMTGKRDPQTGELKAYSRKFVVAGAFKSGWQEIDAHLVYTKREDLIDFLDTSNDVSEISVILDDYANADQTKALLDAKLNGRTSIFGALYPVQKWEEKRQSLLSAIHLEKLVMTIIVSLIVVLAVVSIMIILILMVTEKTKDIGILKAVGANDSGIMSIFVFNGLFISFTGAIVGSLLGYWFSININEISDFVFQYTGFSLFPKDVYYLDRIPCAVDIDNIFVIAASTLLLTLFFCAIPAFKAARMDVVEALNSEAPSLRFLRRRRRCMSYPREPWDSQNRIKPGFFSLRELSRIYKMGDQELQVFKDLELEVKQGEILVIIGASGVGKSTLLHLMGLLDTPDAGYICHKGINLNSYSPKQKAKIRNKDMGFIFQLYHLLPELTALENVMLGAMIRYPIWKWNKRKANLRKQAIELLTMVGLSERMKHRPVELSGGERQRVAVARALLLKPDIVFCDEPTGNLDEETSRSIQKLLWNLNRDLQQTFVIVTHEERIAQEGHRVFRLEHGKLNLVPKNKETSKQKEGICFIEENSVDTDNSLIDK